MGQLLLVVLQRKNDYGLRPKLVSFLMLTKYETIRIMYKEDYTILPATSAAAQANIADSTHLEFPKCDSRDSYILQHYSTRL